MHLKNLVALLVALSGIGLILFALFGLSGCASSSQSHRVTRCLTDPRNNALHCDGETIPWDTAYDYVCHSVDDDAAYLEGCR